MRQVKEDGFIEYNKELEKRIQKEIQKNKEKDKLLFQQNKMA